uniref:DNA-directed RNA polymerase III subunit RPC4 n=1 Tax=Caenorhabditis tropicalis TaxID=1561998 RepID=A0A1I7U6I1_9PELO
MSKPGGRPNLSLAGKKEAPAQQKQNRGGAANRGAGRGRGRGRGRGGGPRERQDLIQTGGVFSEGLSGAFPTKKKRDKDDLAEFSGAKRVGSSSTADEVVPKKEEIKMDGKASFEGYDALWCTDDEDEHVLNTLHPRGFISDLKRGDVAPVVLPSEDQSQFLELMTKRISLEEEEEEKKPGTKEGPTAEQLVRMLENSGEDLLHIQLPSVVAAICSRIQEPPEPVEPMEVDEEAPPPPPPLPSGLPENQKIGKLQVTRDGRLLLQIAGHTVEMTAKPLSGKQQGTVLLEVDPTADQEKGPFSPPPTVENALFHLGNVKHSLIGSMSWAELNREEGGGALEERGGASEGTPATEDLERIEELKREQAKWATQAARWATGLP